jgi:hypothetical protein
MSLSAHGIRAETMAQVTKESMEALNAELVLFVTALCTAAPSSRTQRICC